jgi:hypothetical protein
MAEFVLASAAVKIEIRARGKIAATLWKRERNKAAWDVGAGAPERTRASATRRHPRLMGMGGSQRVDNTYVGGLGNRMEAGKRLLPRPRADSLHQCRQAILQSLRNNQLLESQSGKSACPVREIMGSLISRVQSPRPGELNGEG